ncbi:MAG: hypothetical protein ABIT37_12455 [Luteolibacter sp.]
MLAREITESLKTLSQAELLELKRSVDELCEPADTTAEPAEDRKARIAKAKGEIFTEYDFLLSELAK